MYAKNRKGNVSRPESPILSKVDYTEPNVREMLFDSNLFHIIHSNQDKSMVGIDVGKAQTLGLDAENVPESALDAAQGIHEKAVSGANTILNTANMYKDHAYSAIFNVKDYFNEIIDRVESDLTRIVVCLGDALHNSEIDFSKIISGFKHESAAISRIITLASRGLHIRGANPKDHVSSAQRRANEVNTIQDPGKFEKIIPVVAPEDDVDADPEENEAKTGDKVASSEKDS